MNISYITFEIIIICEGSPNVVESLQNGFIIITLK